VADDPGAQPAPPLVVAFGSNLEDRLSHLRAGVDSLASAGVHFEALSAVYETPPIGFLEQPPFYNMVGLAKTDLPPRELLSIFQKVEGKTGRVREFRNAPRTLDLDLVLFGEVIVREEGLRIPHPRWKGRSFVVLPLAEIAPGLRDPETGWEVEEIARKWAMEPEEIRLVPTSGVFKKG